MEVTRRNICVAFGKPLRVYICGFKSLKPTFGIGSKRVIHRKAYEVGKYSSSSLE
jgi:hypothetical protein